jgi:lysozyme family protein
MFDRMWYLEQWQKCQLKPSAVAQHQGAARKIMGFKAEFYDPAEAKTGVPWYLIGALDCREEDFAHHGYLGNGDSLSHNTTHVPRGRGPFASWAEGAIDALTLGGWDILPPDGHWDLVTALIKSENYNGLGYGHMGLPSPYVWAGTNIQRAGKYVSDGHFDRNAVDTQPGVAGLFLALKQTYGVDLREA